MVVLNQGTVGCPPDIWQCLETFLVILCRGGDLLLYLRARDAAEYPTVHRAAPPTHPPPSPPTTKNSLAPDANDGAVEKLRKEAKAFGEISSNHNCLENTTLSDI